MEDVANQLTKIVNECYDNNGVLVIPAFAVGRSQLLLYYFHQLMEAKKIPLLPIFLDSPMAISVTNLYEKHFGLHKIKVTHDYNELISIFDAPNIHFCNSKESSIALNDMKNRPSLFPQAAMATGGRVLHHLYHRLPRENDTILFADSRQRVHAAETF